MERAEVCMRRRRSLVGGMKSSRPAITERFKSLYCDEFVQRDDEKTGAQDTKEIESAKKG